MTAKSSLATAAPRTIQENAMQQGDTTLSRQHAQDIENARETLRLEANALNEQARILDRNFALAVDLVMGLKGRLIVTGMGKSGHVGKKMAATFASTGTPAYFVHPAEASHGDLGMIGEHDAVLALSRGGESPELRDLVNYCKRFQIPLIAMTAKAGSSLGRQADLLLQLADCAEACPLQQAPTTSTTQTIALGDALAVALMKRRGFSATDYRQFHPGGKLGGRLLTVRSIMHQGDVLPLIRNDLSVNEALAVMSANNFGCAIVTDTNGRLAGFLSDGDIRRNLSPTLGTQSVTRIMATAPRTVEDDALAAAALVTMNQNNITQLVVVDADNVPVGLIRLHDILRAGVA